MGRYYHGDIAVQPSDAGERFGAREQESNYIEYCVYRENVDDINKELQRIVEGGHIARVKNMFENVNGYNQTIMKEYGVSQKDLAEYADYQLGRKMVKFFAKQVTDMQVALFDLNDDKHIAELNKMNAVFFSDKIIDLVNYTIENFNKNKRL